MSMAKFWKTNVVLYGIATALLTVYGTIVCEFIDGLTGPQILPVFGAGFFVAWLLRNVLQRKPRESSTAYAGIELSCWVMAGLVISAMNHFYYGFPLGSGMKVLIGCMTLGFPFSVYLTLRYEYDLIIEIRDNGQRASPTGPSWSIPKRLHTYSICSQIVLAFVVILIVTKDFAFIAEQANAGRDLELGLVRAEIFGAFLSLLLANALAIHQYTKNLSLLLDEQLRTLNSVARGNLEVVVPVISNSEISRIGAKTNDMIDSLKEKEQVKSLFGKLVSPQVARSLMQTSDGQLLKGQEINAAVLFTDLRNFSTLSEQISPQELVSFLNTYFSMIVESVHQFDGLVDKFIGDAAMAVFGFEQTDTEQCASKLAVEAALAIQQGIAGVNQNLRERGLPTVAQGIGIHYGSMIAGNIGSPDRLEFTVIGDAVNTASRLESLCKELKRPILVSAKCHADLPDALQQSFTALGEHKLKGKENKVSVFGVNP